MAWNDGLEAGTAAYTLAASNDQIVRALAGPGSGKSFAIKRKIAKLLEDGISPNKILAITFTRTASQDLKREIQSLGLPGIEEVHARTIHSQALKILMHAEVFERTGRRARMVIDHEIEPAYKDLDEAKFGGKRKKRDYLQNI